ncbi:MAG: serine/threonine protein kinase [Acidimicrobiales bacterium]|nr:serine/threonine protein kinase [Acidimicrobiales bacterium]
MVTLELILDDEQHPLVRKRSTEPNDRRRLRHEAAILHAARHPGVVEVVRVEEVEQRAETVLELTYAGPRTLEDAGRQSAGHVAGLVASLATTVADLHQIGIVHRRIEPSHVVLSDRGLPLLCGFGDAATLIEGSDADAAIAADVLGLGVLLRALVGADGGIEPIPERRWQRHPRWRGYQGRALLNLADVATQDDPERRPSARALATAIHEAMPEATLPVIAEAEPSPPRPEVRRGIRRQPARTLLRPPARPPGSLGVAELGEPAWAPTRDAAVAPPTATRASLALRPLRAIEHAPPVGGPGGRQTAGTREPGVGGDAGAGVGPLAGDAPQAFDRAPEADVVQPRDHTPDAAADRPLDRRADANAEAPPEPNPDATAFRRSTSTPDGAGVGTSPSGSGSADAGIDRPTVRARDGGVPRGPDRPAEGRVARPRPLRPRTVAPDGPRRVPARPDRLRQRVPGLIAAVGLLIVLGGLALVLVRQGHGRTPHGNGSRAAATATASTVPLRPCPGVTGPVADVDGRGCPEGVAVHGRTLSVGPNRFTVGSPGDRVAVGDWDCDGSATPAVVRPSTGEVFVFASWGTAGRPLTVHPTTVVERAVAPVASVSPGSSCAQLSVRRSAGPPVAVTTGARP